MNNDGRFRSSIFARAGWMLTALLAVSVIPLWQMGPPEPPSGGHLRGGSLFQSVSELLEPSWAMASETETPGDMDGDCNVDRDDLRLLLADRNKSVETSACGSRCDLDGDGVITVLDARRLVLLCTAPRCAIVAPSCEQEEPIDCEVSGWSEWSPCSAECGGGIQTRTRTVITPPEHGGQECGALEESRSCNAVPCRVSWQMKQRDMQHTGRADYTVPEEKRNDTFFNTFLWQTPSPGAVSSTSMVFFDGVGPGGKDIVVGGYHWPKGVQGMDRHTGAVFWSGNPEGGENIGRTTPAFSNDGAVIYVANDATANHPLMAFQTAAGPSTFWHNGSNPFPKHLSIFSPTIGPAGRIFLHAWNDRPYGGRDDGSEITEVWAAETVVNAVYSEPSLYRDGDTVTVVCAGRRGRINAYDGATGSELWSVTAQPTDASVTIDPDNGNIYVGAGLGGDIYVVGLDKAGKPLWAAPSMMVFDYVAGENNPQRAQATGALSRDGSTYYFQTNSREGDGRLYAINTADGTLKWSYETRSLGWEIHSSSPIVTADNIIIVGNNDNNTYFAIKDDGSHGTLLDTFVVDPEGTARASATMSPDGKLYLPLRTYWTKGGVEAPTLEVNDLFAAFDIFHESAIVTVADMEGMDRGAAIRAILADGLRIGEITTMHSTSVPAGRVISQGQAPGDRVTEGSSVNLVISLGPPLITVPDVVGMDREAAEATLTAAGLTLGSVSTAHSTSVPPGNVISQQPPAGSSVAEGSVVALEISIRTLVSLRPIPEELYFDALGGTEQLTVIGTYNDGSESDLTPADAHTVYRTVGFSAARVDADGLVTAQSSGSGQILITNGGIGCVVDVDVELPPVDPSPETVEAVAEFQGDRGGTLMARWNPRNGTPRSLFVPGGFLTQTSGDDPLVIARRFILANPNIFLLDESTLDAFSLDSRYTTAHNGVTHIVLRQAHEGIPFRDNLIQLDVNHDGRVVAFSGNYDPFPAYPAMAPTLGADEALLIAARRLSPEDTFTPVPLSGPDGTERYTVFAKAGPDDFDPHTASLVLVSQRDGVHLAWWVMLNRRGQYSVLVDAHDGAILEWFDAVSHQEDGIDALVFLDNPDKGDQVTRHLPDSWFGKENPERPYLSKGPYVDVYIYGGRQKQRAYLKKHYLFEFGGWNHYDSPYIDTVRPSLQNTFYWLNTLYDYFYGLGFDESCRNFSGPNAYKVEVSAAENADDRSPCNTINNSCFYWRRDAFGENRPEIKMGFEFGKSKGAVRKYAGTPVWNANHGLAADMLVHEYTHGVTKTLVAGKGELLSFEDGIQADAASEALSDFFAAAVTNDPAIGDYLVNRPAGIRPYRLDDCPFTYDELDALSLFDFTNGVEGRRSEHDASVLLSSALWGIRERFIEAYGSSGGHRAELLVVDALKMLGLKDPDFLDVRNAMIKADLSPEPGAHREIIWEVFAGKGMGYDAKSEGPADLHPTADFKLPPPEIESVSLGDNPRSGVPYDFRINGIFFSEESAVYVENAATGEQDDVAFVVESSNEIDVTGYTFPATGDYRICAVTEYVNQPLPANNGWHGECVEVSVTISERSPVVDNVTPDSVLIGQEVSVTITGSNFSDVYTITIEDSYGNGVDVAFDVLDDNSIAIGSHTFLVEGEHRIIVVSPAGQAVGTVQVGLPVHEDEWGMRAICTASYYWGAFSDGCVTPKPLLGINSVSCDATAVGFYRYPPYPPAVAGTNTVDAQLLTPVGIITRSSNIEILHFEASIMSAPYISGVPYEGWSTVLYREVLYLYGAELSDGTVANDGTVSCHLELTVDITTVSSGSGTEYWEGIGAVVLPYDAPLNEDLSTFLLHDHPEPQAEAKMHIVLPNGTSGSVVSAPFDMPVRGKLVVFSTSSGSYPYVYIDTESYEHSEYSVVSDSRLVCDPEVKLIYMK